MDSLCSRIEVKRNGEIYKGWQLRYHIPDIPLTIPSCDSILVLLPGTPSVSMPQETWFDLGNTYDFEPYEHYTYFFFNFSLGNCLTIPLRIHFPFSLVPQEDWGNRTAMGKYSSLMEIKRLNGIYNPGVETYLHHSEKERTFLIAVDELDKSFMPDSSSGVHDFIGIRYKGDLEIIPQRYSLDQDEYGYQMDNGYSGSPFPGVYYDPIEIPGLSSDSITPATNGAEKLFGFKNPDAENPDSIALGQNSESDLFLVQTGAIDSIKLATGASISFSYELNELPSAEKGAGIRVAEMTESPFDMPARNTKYIYKDPSVINTPIRIFQHPENYYYHRIEPSPVNPLSLPEDVF